MVEYNDMYSISLARVALTESVRVLEFSNSLAHSPEIAFLNPSHTMYVPTAGNTCIFMYRAGGVHASFHVKSE